LKSPMHFHRSRGESDFLFEIRFRPSRIGDFDFCFHIYSFSFSDADLSATET